jgi:hypothetical protein
VGDKEGSRVAYSVVRKLEPDTVSRQKDRTGTENVFVRGYNCLARDEAQDARSAGTEAYIRYVEVTSTAQRSDSPARDNYSALLKVVA